MEVVVIGQGNGSFGQNSSPTTTVLSTGTQGLLGEKKMENVGTKIRLQLRLFLLRNLSLHQMLILFVALILG